MIRLLPLIALVACTSEPDPGPAPVDACEEIASRTYDTAADPGLYSVADEVMGISNEDVADAMLGSFAGTYTPASGDAFSVEISTSVDGIITVTDFGGDDCLEPTSTWDAVLVFAMSSEQIDGAYLIDDLWSPVLALEGLTAAELHGSKGSEDFDGTLPATGVVELDAAFADSAWTGSMSFDGTEHGSFSLTR